ncbi:agmatine deiminase family protein [Algoriphagus sediminis]|uniref:Agmatine deiminase family protein n=1 Tax=Algoriphagus sediminis TaxID=3057113 RepID=A0ABT7Y9U4_9BACT|nr:agmatine deiminase family protein [Algoriphagus sediminis]MDN3202979.1 agmatine deiminase family protein [Algoriphagus sediminis]
MKFFIPVLLLIFLSCNSNTEEKTTKFTLPPEWESQEYVWVDFPDERNWGQGIGEPDYPARIEIIENLVKYVPVNVILDSDYTRNILDSMLTEANIDWSNLRVYQNPKAAGSAIRDYGPILLTNGEKYQMADFGFDGFGDAIFVDSSYYARAEIDNQLADSLGYLVKPVDLNSEGGGFISSSKVLILFEEFAKIRNPDLSLEQIEEKYLDALGLEKLIWIKEPMLLDKNWHKIDNIYGQGANYHMDAYLRFVNDSTILIPILEPELKDKNALLRAEYEASIKNLEQLKSETNVDGKPFNIVEIPYPDFSLHQYQFPLFENFQSAFSESEIGDTITYVPITGYSNFLITNGAVLVSEYWKEGLPESEKVKDEKMKEILKTYFPDREIIGIKNALMLNWYGGGIHCQTMQIPKLN